MKPVIDTDREYGLVLEGGGAKGAYQIGVWKALIEAGVRIKGIAGASVGGLNGAFIAMGDWEKAKSVWLNLTYSKIMDVDDEKMDLFLKGKAPLGEAWNATVNFIKNRGVDVTPLKHMIAGNVDCEKLRAFPGDLNVVSMNLDKREEEVIDLKDKTDDEIRDFLLATAYMAPVFKTEKVQGTHYVDGGTGDNVPIDVLLKKDYKDIIVVRIFGIGFVRNTKIPEDVNVLEIAPKRPLGSILAFNEENSRKNIVYGYFSGLRVLYGLSGALYYLDEEGMDAIYFLSKLAKMAELFGESILTELFPNLPVKKEKLVRDYVEHVYPGFAVTLGLSPDWSYKELYNSMLEATAKLLKINKWHIYTPDSLLFAIKKAMDDTEIRDFPPFARMIIADADLGGCENEIMTDSLTKEIKDEMEGDYT
ncbi:MAG TPA: patatin-like phospholipase family protein [Lachnospiraceae bacterium]|nr:patatin-like phospholipase family protein [Lachnospiraceae bacterium]